MNWLNSIRPINAWPYIGPWLVVLIFNCTHIVTPKLPQRGRMWPELCGTDPQYERRKWIGTVHPHGMRDPWTVVFIGVTWRVRARCNVLEPDTLAWSARAQTKVTCGQKVRAWKWKPSCVTTWRRSESSVLAQSIPYPITALLPNLSNLLSFLLPVFLILKSKNVRELLFLSILNIGNSKLVQLFYSFFIDTSYVNRKPKCVDCGTSTVYHRQT